MKADKLRDLDTKELAHKAAETSDQIFRLKFQMGMGQMDGLKKYRALKKDLARMLTLQREKEIAATKDAK